MAVTYAALSVSYGVMVNYKQENNGQHRYALMTRFTAATACLAILAVASGIYAALLYFDALPTQSEVRARENRRNLTAAELAVRRYSEAVRKGDVAKTTLEEVITPSITEKINPYTGGPVSFVPFGGPPSPGDITGYLAPLARAAHVFLTMEGFAPEIDVNYEPGYYLYVYGPADEPGLDITWDGLPDGIADARKAGYTRTAKEVCYFLKPLDVIIDENGITHGPAPGTPGQCLWGKPCLEPDDCPLCDYLKSQR